MPNRYYVSQPHKPHRSREEQIALGKKLHELNRSGIVLGDLSTRFGISIDGIMRHIRIYKASLKEAQQ